MGLSRLDLLYRQVILDHSNHPKNFGLLSKESSEKESEITHEIEMNNPTCGDVIQLQLQVEDGIVKNARFAGSGCSISMASASMMTVAVIGKKEQEALELAADFSLLVQGKEVNDKAALGDAAILQGVSKFPARIKCATLAWKAMEKGIYDHESLVTKAQLHSEEKE